MFLIINEGVGFSYIYIMLKIFIINGNFYLIAFYCCGNELRCLFYSSALSAICCVIEQFVFLPCFSQFSCTLSTGLVGRTVVTGLSRAMSSLEKIALNDEEVFYILCCPVV